MTLLIFLICCFVGWFLNDYLRTRREFKAFERKMEAKQKEHTQFLINTTNKIFLQMILDGTLCFKDGKL